MTVVSWRDRLQTADRICVLLRKARSTGRTRTPVFSAGMGMSMRQAMVDARSTCLMRDMSVESAEDDLVLSDDASDGLKNTIGVSISADVPPPWFPAS